MEKGSLLQAVKQCLSGNEKKDRIFPFLWVHGEPHDRLQEEGLRSRLILQVHDELLIEAHESEVEQVKEILAYEMEHAAQLSVPLDVDMHTGENWYEAK